jgi:hypothetical protein
MNTAIAQIQEFISAFFKWLDYGNNMASFVVACLGAIVFLSLVLKSLRRNRNKSLNNKINLKKQQSENEYFEEQKQLVQHYQKLREKRLERERNERIEALRAENAKLLPENTKFTENLMEINILKGDGPLDDYEIEWLVGFENDKRAFNQELDDIRTKPREQDNRAFSLKY